MLNVTSFNIGEITSKVSLNTPSSGIIQRSHPRSKFVRFHSRSPMSEYARKHPGCSLQEYCEYLDNIAREEAERRRLKEEENNQLLKSFEGKCFQINFNRQSFGYFKITKDITALREDVKEDFYEVFIDSNTTRISLEKKRMINRQWLPGQGSEKCTIVPEELFNKVVKYYQEMCTMAEKIRDGEL